MTVGRRGSAQHKEMKREAKDLLRSAGYPQRGIYEEFPIGTYPNRGFVDVVGCDLDEKRTVYLECETDHDRFLSKFGEKTCVRVGFGVEVDMYALSPEGLHLVEKDPVENYVGDVIRKVPRANFPL